MFCHNCGCELPAVAKFCVRCGSRVEGPAATNETLGSFCVNCGIPYDPSYKFCNYCGHPVPHAQTQSAPAAAVGDDGVIPVQIQSHEEIAGRTPEVTASGSPQTGSAPYAAFAAQFLSSTVLFSCVIFTVAHALGRNRWGDTATGFLIVSLLAACWLAVAGRRTWGRVVATEPAGDVGLKRRRHRVLMKSAMVAALFFTVSAVVGNAIGLNGAEAAQVQAEVLGL